MRLQNGHWAENIHSFIKWWIWTTDCEFCCHGGLATIWLA